MNTNVTGVHGDVSKEKLMQDLRVVVADAEELLRATAGQAGEKLSEKMSTTRERIQENLSAAKARLISAEAVVVARTKQAAKATDEYVHENPWKSVGVGAAVGVIVGMLIARGR